MKKYLLIVLLNCFALQAQNDSILFKKNEIKIDLFNLMLLNKASISYERNLNKTFSVGATVLKTTQNHIQDIFYTNYEDKVLTFQLTPYFRYNLNYFDNKSVIYLESFGTYNEGKFRKTERLNDGIYAYYSVIESKYKDFALGGSLGYKQYIFNRMIVDLNAGFGRNIFNTNSQSFVPRIGFNIGYAF